MTPVFSAIGAVEHRNGETFIRTRRFEEGCVVYGPYQDMDPGRYTVTFRVALDGRSVPRDIGCVLDVAVDTKVLVRRPMTVGELKTAGGRIDIPFEVKKRGKGEFRVFATGAAALSVAHARKAIPVFDDEAPPSFARISRSARERARATFEETYPDLVFLSEHGVTCEVDERVVATFGGVSVHIDGREDLQVFTEVFFANEYAFACAQDCLVVDIGMNAGVAALAFAKMRNVRKVVAYEPFRAPFERARRNFALNPEIAAKIEPFAAGLADRAFEPEVMADDRDTIGATIRGATVGRVETIAVRDASEALQPHIAEARARGWRVVLKLDCEGSEFAIFASLARSGLFGAIDAVAVEWHKGWSPNMTQADLIAPLSRAGFMTFDRTDRTSRLTGFLIAVRMAAREGPP